MSRARSLILGAALSIAVLFVGPATVANAIPTDVGGGHAVFVQTNDPTGNQIVFFIVMLFAGLVYLWKTGGLDWGPRRQRPRRGGEA